MKKSLLLMLALSLLILEMLPGQSYKAGDTLTVIAQSGLRLRTSPGTESGTIRVLAYGDPVIVTETFGFDEAHSGKAGWFDGHWIRVRTNRAEGYLFDAFLTRLDVPTHEEELSYDPMRFTAAMENYIMQHYSVLNEQTGIEHREDVDQCITFHLNHIVMTRTEGNGWYKTDIEFEGYRISEVVSLLRSMIVGRDILEEFEASMLFYEDREGRIRKINAGHIEYPVIIERIGDNTIHLSLTEYITG